MLHLKLALICYLIFALLPQCLCEALQIANPPPPDPKRIRLYGPTGVPLESDIQQGIAPNCFLEATLAAIARVDTKTIEKILHDNGDGTVNATFFDVNFNQVPQTVKKKDSAHRISSHDSTSCWVAVLQDTYKKYLKAENSRYDVHNGKGGTASGVIQAIYGESAMVEDCMFISEIAAKANLQPTMLATTNLTNTTGHLIPDHVYTVHSGSESYVVLRNPWGIVNVNWWGSPAAGSKDIEDLGDGVFRIPISAVMPQCDNLQYLSRFQQRLLFPRALHRRPPNRLVVGGLITGVLSILLAGLLVAAWKFRIRFQGYWMVIFGRRATKG